jgi:hypothetical protein
MRRGARLAWGLTGRSQGRWLRPRTSARRSKRELDFDPRVDSAHVRTWAEHDAVIGAASMAIGVIDIRDNLQITG